MPIHNTPNSPIPQYNPTENLYISWGSDSERPAALAKAGEALSEFTVVERTTGRNRSFVDVDTNITVRSPFQRSDYEYYRPHESIPSKHKEILRLSMEAYERVGIVKNVIDLMGDFACQGIKLVHKNPSIERFYQQWFEKVNGRIVSERFLNYLYRMGNVIVRKKTGKFKQSDLDRLLKTFGMPDSEVEWSKKPEKKELPHQYVFLNPMTVDVLGGNFSTFVGKPEYVLTIPNDIRLKIQYPRSEEDRKLVSRLPKEIVELVRKTNSDKIPLDPEKVSVFFYKKDDWKVWANPMTYCILDDLILLEKMKSMDLAAADSAISSVRLWKLGDIKEKIFPTKAAIAKLANIIKSNVNGASYDLIWGPDLDFKESDSRAYQFLGPDKYVAVYNAIYQGLGIPSALSSSSKNQGFNANYFSLKTLIERLAYGRNILVSFWKREIALVQQAMGFRSPASVHFDRMTLSDEAAEKQLLISLCDRDLISMETILERFGEIPEIEKFRLKKERRERVSRRLPNKVSPFHEADPELALKKIFTQLGVVTPSELGIELEERKPGEVSKQEQLNQLAKTKNSDKPKGEPGEGRPKNSKDTSPRKKRRVLPRTSASAAVWARDAQEEIAGIVLPYLFKQFGRKNLRELTVDQFQKVEDIKVAILCALDPFSQITKESVLGAMKLSGGRIPEKFSSLYSNFVEDFKIMAGRIPSVEDHRQLKSLAYMACYFPSDSEGETDG